MQAHPFSAGRRLSMQERQAHLHNLVRSITNVPALSTVGVSLIRELLSGETSAKKLAEIISGDPVMAAAVVRQANSAFYKIPNRIHTLHHAITMLGTQAIKELTFSLCFYSFMRTCSTFSAEFVERFLQRSLTMALLCKKICAYYKFQNVGPGEAHLAGLLTDIGVFVLFRHKRKEYKDCLALQESEGIPLDQAEERVFGCNHCDTGGWLAERWNLPEAIREVIRTHHGSSEEILNQELFAVVQLADAICDQMGVTLASVAPGPRLDTITLKALQSRMPGLAPQEMVLQAAKSFGSLCLYTPEMIKALKGDTEAAPVCDSEDSADVVGRIYAPETLTPPVAQAKPSQSSWLLIGELLLCGLRPLLTPGERTRGISMVVAFAVCWTAVVVFFGNHPWLSFFGLLGGCGLWLVNFREVFRKVTPRKA